MTFWIIYILVQICFLKTALGRFSEWFFLNFSSLANHDDQYFYSVLPPPPHHKKATWNLNCYDCVTTDQLLKNATYSLKTYKKERTY